MQGAAEGEEAVAGTKERGETTVDHRHWRRRDEWRRIRMKQEVS
jgi:hypothetical protein